MPSPHSRANSDDEIYSYDSACYDTASSGAQRLKLDTGSTANIHPIASDLINTRPSRAVFVSADGSRTLAQCVGDLPLLLKDDIGFEAYFLLKEVHAVPSLNSTLISAIGLEQKGAQIHLSSDAKYIYLPSRCESDLPP